MDEQLRLLEKQYLASPESSVLLQILRYYSRIGKVVDGDTRALELLGMGKGIPCKAESYASYEDRQFIWAYQFNDEQIVDLLQLGYPVGTYFNYVVTLDYDSHSAGYLLGDTATRSTDPDAIYLQIIAQIYRLLVRQSENNIIASSGIDYVDDLSVSPYATGGRGMVGSRRQWEINLDNVIQKRRQAPDLLETMQNFSRLLGFKAKKDGTAVITARIFLPVDALERAYAMEVTAGRKGFSRSTVRVHASSTIDWGVPNQVSKLKREFVAGLNIVHVDCRVNNWGCNLLLALSGYFRYRDSWLD